MKVFESNTASKRFKPREGEDPDKHYCTVYGMHIVFGEEDNFEERYYTTVPLAAFGISDDDDRAITGEEWDRMLENLDLQPFKAEAGRLLYKDLYPDFDADKYTVFDETTQTDPDRVFLKENSLLVMNSDDLEEHPYWKRDMLTELKACEVLKESPHPNIVKYLGCRVQGNRVTGLYFERCIDIEDAETPLKVDKLVEDIRKGIEHIHSLGYCHNDISPNNIMLRDDGAAVIVDFDGCLPVGEKLGTRACMPFARDTETSEEENDWFGLRLMEQWMHEWNEHLQKQN